MTMNIYALLKSMQLYKAQEAIIWLNKTYTYEWLLENIENWKKNLKDAEVKQGEIIELAGDCSPTMIGLLFALILEKYITVPISLKSQKKADIYRKITKSTMRIESLDGEKVKFIQYKNSVEVQHPLFQKLITKQHPGLVLFSSGSTGEPKSIVHDWNAILEKYRKRRLGKRVLSFLLFDHIGGLNTILHTLFNGGCLIIPENHSTNAVCHAIDTYRAEVLPTSPTFLNLLLINRCYEHYLLDTIQQITYGTEPMPESLLKKLSEIFPSVRLLQTYGLTELGILHMKSRSSDSLLVKVNQNDDCKVRIRKGMLEIKTRTSMLGYLNAKSPFTKDGWFKTGDLVKKEGKYLRILGRASEIINVGGLKVYPVQVEDVIRQMPEVEDVIVGAESSPVVGQIVKAIVKLSRMVPLPKFRLRLHDFCKERLESFEIPQKIVLVEELDYGDRFKKMRKLY